MMNAALPSRSASGQPARPPISVVLVARNEEARLRRALECVMALGAAEIVVVDGRSTDATVSIAREFPVIVLEGGQGVAGDRQIGIDATRHPLVCLIDADHRPEPDLLGRLWADLEAQGWAMVQAGVTIEETNFWTRAENEAFATFHHRPGPRTMIGTAPTLYRREVFDLVRFDASNRQVSDDADLCLRAHEAGLRFGIAHARVPQEHHPTLGDYLRKFAVYGREDAGFCWKHPHRAPSMLFHLLVRYPVLRPMAALMAGRWRAVPYFWLCAGARLWALGGRLLELARQRRSGKGMATVSP
jgi:glycosyltransferase involved in cell wall biosynthesis